MFSFLLQYQICNFSAGRSRVRTTFSLKIVQASRRLLITAPTPTLTGIRVANDLTTDALHLKPVLVHDTGMIWVITWTLRVTVLNTRAIHFLLLDGSTLRCLAPLLVEVLPPATYAARQDVVRPAALAPRSSSHHQSPSHNKGLDRLSHS